MRHRHRELIKMLEAEGFKVLGIDYAHVHPRLTIVHQDVRFFLVVPGSPRDDGPRQHLNVLQDARRCWRRMRYEELHGLRRRKPLTT